MPAWTLHGDGRTPPPGEIVGPRERMAWGRTIGIGMQHVVAMFGATFLVPLLIGFPPTTTLFFSGVGTLLFLVITARRVPSYLGSSFSFIAPVLAATAQGGIPEALGGIVVAGVALAGVGLLVTWAGAVWIDRVLPPVVTGAIVALIGFNLAPTAAANVATAPGVATVTLVVVLVVGVGLRGMIGRLSILVGVAVGYLLSWALGAVDFSPVQAAAWAGLPTFTAPSFSWAGAALMLPVVVVLVAENVGHVKAVAAMTGEPLDDVMGRALTADGVATAVAGMGGGSGTTTYAENIGVMAATRVYSTAAYLVAGLTALLLSLSPKVGALISTIPAGVLGGVTLYLYGLIGVLGARIWIQGRVDFSDPVNLSTAGVALVLGIANVSITWGQVQLTGIAVGSFAALLIYHGLTAVRRLSGGSPPGDVAGGG